MKIIVTGGCGFIGSRVVRALAHDPRLEGASIVAADIRPPETPLMLPRTTYAYLDVMSRPDVEQAVRGAHAVIHLAGPVAENFTKEKGRHAHFAMMTQVQGTLNLADSSAGSGVKRFLLASSFYLYDGMWRRRAVSEDSLPDVHEVGMFGLAKIASEGIIRNFAKRSGMSWASLRFGSVYGWDARCTNVIVDMVRAGLTGEKFVVWGKGERKNQYTYVHDIVDGIVRALHYPHSGRFNLISPEVLTTVQAARVVSEVFGSEIVFDPDKPEGPSFPRMSSAVSMRKLGWAPTPLVSGLKRMKSIADGGAEYGEG